MDFRGPTLSRRGWTRVAVLLATCAGLLGLLGLQAGPALANTPSAGLGMNGWYLFWEMPQSSWSAQLANMEAAGVRDVRADALWASAEPAAPTSSGATYDWSTLDAIAGALAQHNMTWLPIIDYSAPWTESVSGDEKSPPSSDSAYAAYAAAVVARYGPGGTFWADNPSLTPHPVTAVEIWNEPNVTDSAIAPAQYATLYEDARTAIHTVDPAVEAIVGGLGNPAATYLDEMYQTLGGPGKIDAVADHPYDDTPTEVETDVYELRMALDAEGDANVPIDVTEFGWPTSGSYSWITTLTDAERATDMTDVIQALSRSDCGVERIFPYAWITDGEDTSADNTFGITDAGAATDTSAAVAQEYESLEASAEPASATDDLCGRPYSLTLTQTTVPSGSSDNLCVSASADSWGPGGWGTVGIEDSTVTFSKPAALTVTTGSDGEATGCWKLAAGKSEAIAATAADPQFTEGPAATLTATASGTPVKAAPAKTTSTTDSASVATAAPSATATTPPTTKASIASVTTSSTKARKARKARKTRKTRKTRKVKQTKKRRARARRRHSR